MKVVRFLAVMVVFSGVGFAQDLSITRDGAQQTLSWMRSFPPNSGVETTLDFCLCASTGDDDWNVVSSSSVDEGSGSGTMSVSVPTESGAHLFRLETAARYAHRASSNDQPATYDQQYANALSLLGDVPFQRFQAEADRKKGLPQISWDPTTATYWTEFNTPPSDPPANPEDPRMWDFSLTPAEVTKFTQNGFVVSRNQQDPTPVDAYYRIWTDDLPVFITADSVLDAWHRSFSYLLEELEELYLYPNLRNLVAHTTSSVGGSFGGEAMFFPPSEIADGGLTDYVRDTLWFNSLSLTAAQRANVQEAIKDVEFYLTVGSGLLVGVDLTPRRASSATVTEWYDAAVAASLTQKIGLYGDMSRLMDMTQFIPRGHYANSPVLESYFRGFMWLSTAGFRMGGGNPTAGSDREFRAAALLALAIRDAGYLTAWDEIENVAQSFFGQADGMTVREMISFLESNSADTLADLGTAATVTNLRSALLATTYGVREIPSGNAVAGCNPSGFEEARYLTLFGQRWTPDSWGLSKTVFPFVEEEGVSLYRRMPSNVEVGYAVLGNCAAMPVLVDRMEDATGVPFRDGYKFHRNLAAVRGVIEGQAEEFWTESIYGSWMYALRALSKPQSSSAPETFQTHAWGLRTLNAQLGSWTQLRHDTVLYAAQSYTPPVLCDFPDGYVEPNVEFWERMEAMATQLEGVINALPLTASVGVAVRGHMFSSSPPTIGQWLANNDPLGFDPAVYLHDEVRLVDAASVKSAMVTHLSNFAQVCVTLKSIVNQQIAGLAHTPAMTTFIRDTVEDSGDAYIQERTYSGWFPGLYYTSFLEGAGGTDPSALVSPVVVDVHTDSADPVCSGDPGGVLHQGIGKTNLMMVAVQHPSGNGCVYAGPVFSQYEFVEPVGTRLTDEEWEVRVENSNLPAPAPWQFEFIGE